MYTIPLIILTICILTNGLECPDYCTCLESFVPYTEDKSVRAKCTQIDGLAGSILSNINAIDLSASKLSDVSTNFKSFKILSELNLSYNELTKIPKLNNRITNLTLSHNQLTSSTISKLPLQVQHLDLAYNGITTLPNDMMRLNQLRKLELFGNPIDCNCDSIRVRNWLVKRLITTETLITCATPKRFENRSWLEVNEFDVCEFQKIKKTENFIEPQNHDSMLADQPISNTDLTEGSGDDQTTTIADDSLLQPVPTVDIPLMAAAPKSSGMPYLTMAKEVIDLLPKKKSEDGKTEVYATSGTAGVIIIALTIFAVYKKHHTGGANLEKGQDGEELKTIGGLELATATQLIMSIDNQVKSEDKADVEVKTADNVQDLQAAQA